MSIVAIENFEIVRVATAFKVEIARVELFTSVILRVGLLDSNHFEIKSEFLTLSGTDYAEWSNHDGYIVEYVAKHYGFTAIPEVKESASEAQTESASEAQTESGPEAQTESASEAQTESASEVQTENVPEAQTENVPEAQTESGPEAQTDGTPEAQTDGTPEAQTDGTPEAQTDGTPEAQTV